MVDLLNARLADAIDLFNMTKQAHWNVKGPNFIALHELFDDIAERIEAHADLIAERAVILGGIAQGPSQAVGEASTLEPYPRDLQDANGTVDRLSAALAAFGANVRKAIDAADEAGDQDTADLFTEVSRAIDKDVWFVEAHSARYA
jgi:starvation-inducible DNA-binding protein